MSEAWVRFGRWRLARTRWQCEPQALPRAERRRFLRQWRRQRYLERAVVEAALARAPTVADEVGAAVEASLAALLDEAGLAPDAQREVVRHHALMESQFAWVASGAPLPDEASVRAWSEKHRARWVRPEQRLTHHLLITVDGDREEAYRRVQQFHHQISLSRPAFAALARRYSHCPTALEDGRMGWIGRGLLFPELEQCLFALAENDVSQPVETALGWHLLWCEAIRPEAPLSQQDALARARAYLWQQARQRHQRRWLAELLEQRSAALVLGNEEPASA